MNGTQPSTTLISSRCTTKSNINLISIREEIPIKATQGLIRNREAAIKAKNAHMKQQLETSVLNSFKTIT